MSSDMKVTKALLERELTLKKSASECFNLGQADAFQALALIIEKHGMTPIAASVIKEKSEEYEFLFSKPKNEEDAHLVRVMLIRTINQLSSLYRALGIPRTDDRDKEYSDALAAINGLQGALEGKPCTSS